MVQFRETEFFKMKHPGIQQPVLVGASATAQYRDDADQNALRARVGLMRQI